MPSHFADGAKWDRRARSAGVELETAAHANGVGARPHVWAATCVGAVTPQSAGMP